MSRAASTLAPAKVNLYLRVLGRRPDGFHEIETLFQAIDLCDEISVALEGSAVRLDVDGPDLGPTTENLAYRAATMFVDAADLAEGVRIELTKRIPAGAGLGGGSSDAAAVLRLLDHLCPGRVDAPGLMAIGEAIGSDVPFFLGASVLALGRGRGERLVACDPLSPHPLLLVLPPVHVATGEAYRSLSSWRAERTAADARTAPRPTALPEPGSWADVAAVTENDFEHVVPELYPQVARALQALRSNYPVALLSGSGGACFGLDPAVTEVTDQVPIGVADLGWPTRLCRTLTAPPEIVDA